MARRAVPTWGRADHHRGAESAARRVKAMGTLELLRANLLSPVLLAFLLGIAATAVRSDLKFPDEIYTIISVYLLLAIGLKGGAELSDTSLAAFWRPALATITLGIVIPILAFGVLRRLGNFDVADAAAIAAHYGSVSLVTFLAAVGFLEAVGRPAEPFVTTLVAILEVPAIVVALMLARTRLDPGGSWGTVLHEVLAGRSVFLLVGGLAIGYLSGKPGLLLVAPFFVEPFYGVLFLFLLDLGMLTARRLRDLRQTGPFLVGFALVMPVLQGSIGAVLGHAAGLSVGGTTILAVLAASASYIAAPAAVRIALPQANPGYYLTAALGITFPFNLTVGIPLYYAIARFLHGV